MCVHVHAFIVNLWRRWKSMQMNRWSKTAALQIKNILQLKQWNMSWLTKQKDLDDARLVLVLLLQPPVDLLAPRTRLVVILFVTQASSHRLPVVQHPAEEKSSCYRSSTVIIRVSVYKLSKCFPEICWNTLIETQPQTTTDPFIARAQTKGITSKHTGQALKRLIRVDLISCYINTWKWHSTPPAHNKLDIKTAETCACARSNDTNVLQWL